MTARRIRYALTCVQSLPWDGWSWDNEANVWLVAHGLAKRVSARAEPEKFELTELGTRLLANVDAYLSQTLGALQNQGQLKGPESHGSKKSRKAKGRNHGTHDGGEGTKVEPQEEEQITVH